MPRKSYVDEKLKSFARVNKIAEYALDKAEELGLTQQETEEIPEQIKQILKWERCRDNIKYKRPFKREKAKKKRKSVCIDPDSVIGKEIMYQTALLHEILDEIRGERKANENRT